MYTLDDSQLCSGRHEEAARLKAMIAPPEQPQPKKKSKKHLDKKKRRSSDEELQLNPLALFEKEWNEAEFVCVRLVSLCRSELIACGCSESREIEMAFALDATDVESFMAEADFSCVASGAQEVHIPITALYRSCRDPGRTCQVLFVYQSI